MKSKLWTYVAAAVFGLVIIGCGGGGGLVAPPITLPFGSCTVLTQNGTISYVTTWGTAPVDASQVLQVLDVDGYPLRTDSLNRSSGAAVSNLTLANITAGVHRLRVTLYAGPNASGAVLGVTETAVDFCSNANGTTVAVNTEYGVTPTKLTVFVNGLTWKQQQVAPYVASAYTPSNRLAFVAPGAVSWSVAGGVGTIDSAGQFTATTVGSGQVVAAIPAASLQTTVDVTVTSQVITTGKWTIMVYMNAANDLYSFSDDDINEMEQIASNPDVRIVVQWKQSKAVFSGSSFDGVRRYLIKHDTSSQVLSELVQTNLRDISGNALDMGSPQTLNDFVTWAKANYPATRYAVVLWNHGNGWRRSPDDDQPTRAFSYDDQYGTSIKTWQTDAAFAGHHFDIMAWDSSLMQMAEVAYEARSYADYIVGSEESPPGEGYPYHQIFDDFTNTPDATTTLLAKAIVDGMVNYGLPGNPYASRKITQSAIDTSKLADLATSINALGLALQTHGPSVPSSIQIARNTAQSYSPLSTRVYRDLVHLCLILEADLAVPVAVKTACADVRAKVAAAVVWEGHNANSANSHGISIDFSDSGTFLPVRTDYIQLELAQDTNWDEWLGLAP